MDHTGNGYRRLGICEKSGECRSVRGVGPGLLPPLGVAKIKFVHWPGRIAAPSDVGGPVGFSCSGYHWLGDRAVVLCTCTNLPPSDSYRIVLSQTVTPDI